MPSSLGWAVVRSDSRGFTGGSGRFVPPSNLRSSFSACSSTVMSNFAPSSVHNGLHRSTASSNASPRGTNKRRIEIGERGFIGRGRSRACAAFAAHVANGHAAINGARMASLPYSAMCRVPPPIFPIITRLNVFCGDAFGSLSVHDNVQRFQEPKLIASAQPSPPTIDVR